MRKVTQFVLAASLLFATSASAQMSAQPGMESASNDTFGVDMIAVEGKITTIDLAQGLLTLDNGAQLSLPTSFQYTSYPAIGDQVQVTYAKDGENKVVRAIDRETSSDGSHD